MLAQATAATSARAWEPEIVAGLAGAIAAGAPGTLAVLLRPEFDAAADERARPRVVIDQITSLGDASALAWHQRMCSLGRMSPAHSYC